MSMPSDGFLKAHFTSTGGALLEKLPELEAQQIASAEAGEKRSLAELAQAAGVVDEAELGALAAAESAAAPKGSAAAATPSKKTGTAGVKKPSASKTPAAPAAKPAAAPAAKPSASSAGKPTASGVKKGLAAKPGAAGAPTPSKASKPAVPAPAEPSEDEEAAPPTPSKKGITTPSKKGIAASKKGGAAAGKKGRGAPEPAPAGDPNKMLMIAAGCILVVGLVAAAVIVSGGSSNQQQPPQVADSTNGGGSSGGSGGNSGGSSGGNTGGGTVKPHPIDESGDNTSGNTGAPDLGSLTPEEQKEREDLQERAGEIVGLAHGDEFGRAKALKMISVLETSASKKNMDIVRKTKAKVNDLIQAAARSSARDVAEGAKHAAEEEQRKKAEDEARRKADEDAAASNPARNDPTKPQAGPSSEPAPPPNPSLLAYQDFSKKLYPALAAFDFDKSKKLLGEAPDLDGASAKDLEDDKAAIAVLQKLCDYAGSLKVWKNVIELENQSFTLANGTKITGTLKKVENNTLTVFMSIGGEQEIKIQELVAKDFLAYARQGCPKEERGNMFAGRGLAFYYAGDLDGAKTELDNAAKESGAPTALVGRFQARITRDRLLRGSGSPSTPTTPAKPTPADSPAPPADPNMPTPTDPSAGASPTPSNTADINRLKEYLRGATVTNDAGKISISYNTSQDAMAQDFTLTGDVTLGKSDTWYTYALYFACGSKGAGGAIHSLYWKGDFDITVEYMLNNSINNPTALTFLMDFTDGKKTHAMLTYLGQILAKQDGNKPQVISGDYEPKSFGGEKRNTVRFVRKGEDFTLYFNGGKRGSTKLTGFGPEARFGFSSVGMPFWISKLDMKGTPNMDKVK